jgi:hypothetical protein
MMLSHGGEMKNHPASRLLIAISLAMALCSCEVPRGPTSISVGGGPSFSLRGSARLAIFTIYAPAPGHKLAAPYSTIGMTPNADLAPVIWQIKTASSGLLRGSRIDGLQLTYGKVPKGYTQTVPSQSQAPQTLAPQTIYSFDAESTAAAGKGGFFYVDKTGAVQQLQIPELCTTLKDNQWVMTDCKTRQPYNEPTDIAKFAHEHQSKE